MGDSTYVVKAEVFQNGDTVFYQVPEKDLKILYEQAFGEMINADSARDHLILTLTYVPLILIFILLITLVNIRWNKAYRRLKSKQSEVELSEKDKENIQKLDLQYYKVPDRIFVYTVIWLVAAIFDTLLITFDIFDTPWMAILAAGYSINKIIERLIGGSTLMGVDDSDIIENYGKYVQKMIVDSIPDRIKNLIKGK
jgi:hypothetical protein